jgi:hypothetical protein
VVGGAVLAGFGGERAWTVQQRAAQIAALEQSVDEAQSGEELAALQAAPWWQEHKQANDDWKLWGQPMFFGGIGAMGIGVIAVTSGLIIGVVAAPSEENVP